MSLPIVLSPETAYATKDNIVYPGNEEKAESVKDQAKDRLKDVGITGARLSVPHEPDVRGNDQPPTYDAKSSDSKPKSSDSKSKS